MSKKFRTELLDVVYFARPSLLALDPFPTAERIRAKRTGGSPRSYDEVIAAISQMIPHFVTLEDVQRRFDNYADQQWADHLRQVCAALFPFYHSRPCSWYPVGRKPRVAKNGIVAKPPIRGVLVEKGQPWATLINPRSSCHLDDLAVSFLARGVDELYVRDAFGVSDWMILDVSRKVKEGDKTRRVLQVYDEKRVTMMSEKLFANILRRYLQAVKMAGYSIEYRDDLGTQDIFDVFKGSNLG